MRIFDLQPCREIGSLKSSIKDAILDGIIPNEHDAALEHMLKKAKSMGLTQKTYKKLTIHYTKGEEWANTLSHGVGILIGIAGGGYLLLTAMKSGNPWATGGMWLYLFGMLSSYISSTGIMPANHLLTAKCCANSIMLRFICISQAAIPPSC